MSGTRGGFNVRFWRKAAAAVTDRMKVREEWESVMLKMRSEDKHEPINGKLLSAHKRPSAAPSTTMDTESQMRFG
jgi:hypothetical protein